jgi:hypothetical protein
VRPSWDAPRSQVRSWTESAREAETETRLTHRSARWDRAVLCGDGNGARGLDHSPLRSIHALVRVCGRGLCWPPSRCEEEPQREIQRRHRRRLLMWWHKQTLAGVPLAMMFDRCAA